MSVRVRLGGGAQRDVQDAAAMVPRVLAKVICLDCRYGWTENNRHTMLL